MLFLFRLNLEKPPAAAVTLDDPVFIIDEKPKDEDEPGRDEVIVLIAHLI
jgi:hypothetical protein